MSQEQEKNQKCLTKRTPTKTDTIGKMKGLTSTETVSDNETETDSEFEIESEPDKECTRENEKQTKTANTPMEQTGTQE